MKARFTSRDPSGGERRDDARDRPIEFSSANAGESAARPHNPEAQRNAPESLEAAPFQLGEASPILRPASMEEIRTHAMAMLQQARRSICIYTDDLESWLYDHSSVERACSDFLVSRPRNQLRILVRDSSRAVRNGHRLIRLARKLTSNLHIRKVNPIYDECDGALLIVDDCGVLQRLRTSSIHAEAHYASTMLARRQLAAFERAWERALPDPNLRSFTL